MYREYSVGLISLLKGIVYDHQKDVWDNVVYYEAEIKKYIAPLGLELWLDKSEGYAYLRQVDTETEQTMPKLAEKRQLNFHVSLLCLILRRHLLEADSQAGAGKTTINYQDIINRMQGFFPEVSDEAKQHDKIITTINKVAEIGFLRKIEDGNNDYEIHRIIKGFINADIVDDMLSKLKVYAEEKNVTD